MDSAEFTRWQAWLQLHPYGTTEADDLRWCLLICGVLNQWRERPVEAAQLFPHLADLLEAPEQSPATLKALARAFADGRPPGPAAREPAPAPGRRGKNATLR